MGSAQESVREDRADWFLVLLLTFKRLATAEYGREIFVNFVRTRVGPEQVLVQTGLRHIAEQESAG
jgi:hypothetical protein